MKIGLVYTYDASTNSRLLQQGVGLYRNTAERCIHLVVALDEMIETACVGM